MAERDFPTVADYPLPAAELRTPLRPAERDSPGTRREAAFPDANDLCEAMTPLISAAIARKARQRRYTP